MNIAVFTGTFNPFTIGVMGVIAGCLLIVYGIAELISTFRLSKVIVQEDDTVDEQ